MQRKSYLKSMSVLTLTACLISGYVVKDIAMLHAVSASEKKAKRLWGLLKLGVARWIADKVSGWGEHYQLVAQKSVLNRDISKPALAKRGLVSCLDYYLERHALNVS
ncbi:hypothetical protein HK211_11090 [Streptococcus agalactiae]|nr:hypothetical protein [Streptococcus agalactiae]